MPKEYRNSNTQWNLQLLTRWFGFRAFGFHSSFVIRHWVFTAGHDPLSSHSNSSSWHCFSWRERSYSAGSPSAMLASDHQREPSPARGTQWFTTTQWSVVLTAGDSASPQAADALEKLFRTYWYPLYVYVRRQGYSPEDAQDLTQDFFARLLEKNYLSRANPQRGRFRSFLLTSLQNF